MLKQDIYAAPAPVEPAQTVNHGEHIATIPNAMTGFRAVAAIALPIYMARGGNLASIPAALAVASDKESFVADIIDKKFPGWGRSEFGKRADPIADTLFGAGMAVGTARSPKVPKSAKVAAAINTIKVTKQAAWAAKTDKQHREIFGEPYVADVEMVGKIGTAAMLAATAAGTVAGDLNPNKRGQAKARNIFGATSIGFAATGLAFGEVARRRHDSVFKAKVAAHAATQMQR